MRGRNLDASQEPRAKADMHQPLTESILKLFRERGDSQYGREPVTQAEHALQAACFAEKAGADSALIAAALMHDIGHLLHNLDDDAPERGIDDRHEVLAADWLESRFGPEVVEPVKLHVAAKRFLCTTDPSYLGQLSPASVLSFKLQGGMMSEEELATFRGSPFYESAIRLRKWDDAAKIPEMVTPSIDYFGSHLDRVLVSNRERQ